MSTCKVTKILAFTSMEIPTNTNIYTRSTIAINGYTGRYEKVTRSQKRSHLALQKRCILLQRFVYFMQPFFNEWMITTKYYMNIYTLAT